METEGKMMARVREINKDLPPMMRRRKQRSGKIFYYFDTGKKPRHEIPLGSNYVEAVRKWSHLYQPDIDEFEIKKITLQDAWQRYSKNELHKRASNTQRDYVRHSRNLLKFFESAPLDEIEPQHVAQYLQWRCDAPIQANREKALFSTLFNHCRSWGLTSSPNPCAGVKGHKEIGRSNYVEDEIFFFVMENADPILKNFMKLLYLTGQRSQDIFAMSPKHIDVSIIQIVQGKTGQKIRMNLSDENGKLFELGELTNKLLLHREKTQAKNHFLLVDEKGEEVTASAIGQRFRRLRKKLVAQLILNGQAEMAGRVAGYQLRDLRAKAGTDTADASGDIRTAQKQLGHKNLSMTEHYIKKRRGDRVNPTR